MDERRAHFLSMFGDACLAAGVASIPVEIVLRDGTTRRGLPLPKPELDGEEQMNETGYASELLIDSTSVALEDVVEFAIHTPDVTEPLPSA